LRLEELQPRSGSLALPPSKQSPDQKQRNQEQARASQIDHEIPFALKIQV
jgi:hypothetical protein